MPQEASHRDRAERLIGEVKKMFNSMSNEDGELISPLNDLIQRHWMVDSVERLGIDIHFENSIDNYIQQIYSEFDAKFLNHTVFN